MEGQRRSGGPGLDEGGGRRGGWRCGRRQPMDGGWERGRELGRGNAQLAVVSREFGAVAADLLRRDGDGRRRQVADRVRQRHLLREQQEQHQQ